MPGGVNSEAWPWLHISRGKTLLKLKRCWKYTSRCELSCNYLLPRVVVDMSQKISNLLLLCRWRALAILINLKKTASFRETGLYFQMSGTLLLKVLWCRHKTRDKDSFCRNKSFKIWKQKISQKLNDKSLNYKISGIWLSDWQARLGLLLGGSDNHSDSCAPAGRKAKSAIVFTINTVCLPAQRDIVSLGATSPIMQ